MSRSTTVKLPALDLSAAKVQLRARGRSGSIVKVEHIGNLACYRDVASLPEAPDVGIVLLGAGIVGL